MNRKTVFPHLRRRICLFLTAACLIAGTAGCSLFTDPDRNGGSNGPGAVSAIRQEEIRKTGSFRCFLPPDTPDAVRILLLRTGSRMKLTPSFRTSDPRIFPGMLRSGYADAAYSPISETGAEQLQLRSIALPVGGLLLIRPDDPVWEEQLREAIPQE